MIDSSRTRRLALLPLLAAVSLAAGCAKDEDPLRRRARRGDRHQPVRLDRPADDRRVHDALDAADAR